MHYDLTFWKIIWHMCYHPHINLLRCDTYLMNYSVHESHIRVGKVSLRWRHNGHDCVSNHQPRHCLLKRLFELRSKKTSKLRVTGLCAGKSPGPVNSPHKGPVTRKMLPFDDVIMLKQCMIRNNTGRSSIYTQPLCCCPELNIFSMLFICTSVL